MAFSYAPDRIRVQCPSCKCLLTAPNFKYTWTACPTCQFPFVLGWAKSDPSWGEWLDRLAGGCGSPDPTGCHHCHYPVPYGANTCLKCSHNLRDEEGEWPESAKKHLRAHPDLWKRAFPLLDIDSYVELFSPLVPERLAEPKPEPKRESFFPESYQPYKPTVLATKVSNWLGSWDSVSRYDVGDGVFYEGTSYVCLVPDKGRKPFGNPAWEKA